MNIPQPKPRLLVADDEVEIGEIIEAVAEDLGFDVTCVTDGSQVVALVESLQPEVVALDLRMPGADGVEIIRELGKKECQSNFLLMSGMDQRTLSSVQALGKENNLEIAGTLTKPMSVDAIESALAPFLESDKVRAITPAVEPSNHIFDFGMAVHYEPEFQLNPLAGSTKNRLRVALKWLKDDGTVLSDRQLLDWGDELNISKGLSRMVLSQSLETVRIWSNQDFSPEIAIRLDIGFLSDLNAPDILAAMTDKFHVAREFLVIEIDEASLANNQNQINDVLSRLHIKGFKVAVNIQSAGESILPMLDSLPIDQIIVDMSSLQEIPNFLNDMESEFLYSSLTSVANNKGVLACAANVNSKDQFKFVQQCKFNSARGTQILSPGAAATILPLYTEGKFSHQSNLEILDKSV